MAKSAEAPAKIAAVTIHCMIKNGFTMSHNGGPPKQLREGVVIPTGLKDYWSILLVYGPNPGIDVEKWKIWEKENQEYSAYKSGHIFATPEV